MPIRRQFLDWTLPALPAAAEFLLRGRVERGAADLRRTIVVVPTGWAGRRLLELLVGRAEGQSVALVPPRIVTIGEFPELLYEAKHPFADDLTQQLAWIEALRQTPQEDLARVIRQAPAEDDLFSWLALGEMLATLHWEMAGDGLDFSHVVDLLAQFGGESERRRWQVLADVQQRYLRTLDALELWDMQTARLFAIEHREFRAPGPVVLVGMADLNRAQRQILDQIADAVTALVVAPSDMAPRFDEHGCVVPEAWRDVCIDRVFEQTETVEGPGDQAVAVGRALASFGEKYAAEEVVIGVPDERVVPYVRQRMEECGIPVRHVAGEWVAQSGPGRLLRFVSEYLASGRFPAFASLVRHPAVEHWLAARGIVGDWLTQLDNYYGQKLPTRLVIKRLEADKDCGELCKAFNAVTQLLDGLHGAARPLKDWTGPILRLLAEVYGQRPLDPDDPHDHALLAACDQIRAALRRLEFIKDRLAPRVNGAEALRLVLRSLAGELIPPQLSEPAVEMRGWFELPLDDAPALVLTGMNEGIVPESRNGDVFLPNELRRQLGLEDNERRYARDAYFLSLLAASRKELKIIAGRRTADHDPLAPSRLLFACEDGRLADRVLKLFSAPPSQRRVVLPGGLRPGRDRHGLEVPQPLPLPRPVTGMRVTEFADYLACPYRYYLRRRLDLAGPDTQAEELSPPAFGELLHETLEAFGRDAEANSLTDADRIVEFLSATLDDIARRFYGDDPMPAVRVQFEQVRYRLKAFAQWQARWAADGWRIEHAEQKFRDDRAALSVDALPMALYGRIDRIDARETSRGREYVVFDYKTGESGTDPEKKHRKSDGTWIDLQLPLYRHLIKAVGIAEPVRLGYVLLPKDVRRTGSSLAEWTDADLAEADRVAADIVRNVRAQRFWPPSPDANYFAEFAAICQDDLYGAMTDGEDSLA